MKLAKVYPVHEDAEHNLLLEDLAVNFPFPATGNLNQDATDCVLTWLANFHSSFFGIHNYHSVDRVPLVPPPKEWRTETASAGVWRRGTYWYLDTRNEELENTDEEEYDWLLPWAERVSTGVGSLACS